MLCSWAAGVERLVLALQAVQPDVTKVCVPPAVSVITLARRLPLAAAAGADEEAQSALSMYGFWLTQQLRARFPGVLILNPLTQNLKTKMAVAADAGSAFSVIIGSDEAQSGAVMLKDMQSRTSNLLQVMPQNQPLKMEADSIEPLVAALAPRLRAALTAAANPSAGALLRTEATEPTEKKQ
jgi:histidyl-tRNA synthetase